MKDLIFETDSYKWTHADMYPEGTTTVYSYLEAREGAEHEDIVFFGLLPLLRELEGVVVTQEDVEKAAALAAIHLGPDVFNREGWEFIVNECDGKLPLRIKAVPEGTVVPVSNVLMTVENTRPEAFWLTNALESYLLHVWYPTTVASLSRATKKMIAHSLEATGCGQDGLGFMLHDFGYRGATTKEAAAIGGAGHLVNFSGTDTLPALLLAIEQYAATPETLAFSVPASEHSIMTAMGANGELDQVQRILDRYPSGIVSIVADSYNIYEFVDAIGNEFREQILARDGKVVVRPDSTTQQHPQPGTLMVNLFESLYDNFGGTLNDKGFRVLNPKVGLIWGDGIDPKGIEKILNRAQAAGIAAENFVFGMGGGLLQKVNRDTERFAFKSSAQERGGRWFDVFKKPLDSTKTSKKGRLKLSLETAPGGLGTQLVTSEAWMPPHDHVLIDDVLQLVFEDGIVYNPPQFEEIRERAAL